MLGKFCVLLMVVMDFEALALPKLVSLADL